MELPPEDLPLAANIDLAKENDRLRKENRLCPLTCSPELTSQELSNRRRTTHYIRTKIRLNENRKRNYSVASPKMAEGAAA